MLRPLLRVVTEVGVVGGVLDVGMELEVEQARPVEVSECGSLTMIHRTLQA